MARNKKSAVPTVTEAPTFSPVLEVERSPVAILTDRAGKWYRQHLQEEPEPITAGEALRLYGELQSAAYTLDLVTDCDRPAICRLIGEVLAEKGGAK